MKNLVAYLTLALFAFVGVPTADAQAIKWHPGHYVLLVNNPLSRDSSHIDEIAKVPAIKGVQKKIWWHELEPSKGNYDFSKIDAYLTKLKSLSTAKRLVVQIMDRRFQTTSRTGIVPAYLLSESQYKGGVAKTTNGYVARLWEKPVMDRLVALYRALGARYDGDNYFEGIATSETSMSFAQKPDGYSPGALAQQYQRLAVEVRKSMPRTNLFLYTNWIGSSENMSDLIQGLVVPSVAVGGPNTMPDNLTLGQRVWTGELGADFRGLLAISSGVEESDLVKRDFTPKQLHDFAYNKLRVNHMFWVRNTYSGDTGKRWSTGILPFLKTNPPVRTACPTSYGICATK